MSLLLHCLLLATFQFEDLFAQDLKSIFHIPTKRNYDELEILERSNFGGESTPSPSSGAEQARPYANAQVMVRFGSDFEKGRCSCGERCQCGNNPVVTPTPYCWCTSLLPPPLPPQIQRAPSNQAAPVKCPPLIQIVPFVIHRFYFFTLPQRHESCTPPHYEPISSLVAPPSQRHPLFTPPCYEPTPSPVAPPSLRHPLFPPPCYEPVAPPSQRHSLFTHSCYEPIPLPVASPSHRQPLFAPPCYEPVAPPSQRHSLFTPPCYEPIANVPLPVAPPVRHLFTPSTYESVLPTVPLVVSPQIQLRPLPVTPSAKPENVSPAPPPPSPSTTPCQPETDKEVKKESVDDSNVENKNNHPEIMKTVELSEDSITVASVETSPEKDDEISTTTPASNEIFQDTTAKLLEEVSNKLAPKELSPNVKFVDFDVSTASEPPKKQLEDCLIPYRSSHLQQPKLLVTYPIFNRADEPPMVQYSSGYSISGGAGYYSDPAKTVIYKQPTVMSIVPPQSSIVSRPQERYMLVPVVQPTPSTHSSDCSCCSCAKYVGELNQQEKM